MIRPDPMRKYFVYRGRGVSEKNSTMKLKKGEFGGYYFVALLVRNACLCLF